MAAALLAAAMLIISCGKSQKPEEEEATKYDLMTVTTQDYQLQTEYAAQVKGAQDIRVIPRVEGYLQDIRVKEGDHVRKGQLLFVIDRTAYEAAVQQAEAVVMQNRALVEKARQDCEGKRRLQEQRVISTFELQQAERDLDVAETNLAAAHASLKAARNNLSFTELRSPSDGVIGRIPYRRGDLVGPGIQDGLTIVSDNRQMYVYFSLTESRVMDYLAEYASMQEAIGHMPALSLVLPNGQTYVQQGHVESVSGIVDEQTGAVSVRAVFPNPQGRQLSGGTARVVMPQTHKGAIVIPQEATFEVLDKVYVYKVAGGKATSTLITVERLHDGKSLVVTSGLRKGDIIIAKGAGLVRDGARVK